MTRIQLFNRAYRLAFQQMVADEELQKKPSGLASRLKKAVETLCKEDANPSFIAIEAIARLKS